MFDILIKNGKVIDGTGTKAYLADIAIKDSKIVEVVLLADGGKGIAAEAETIIDATGKLVTPGFIDVHGHSDVNILANPNGESKLRQGITSEINANCGDGVFPLSSPTAVEDVTAANSDLEVPITWRTIGEYFSALDAAKPAYNIATLLGHGTLRLACVGYDDRRPTDSEMKKMLREIDIAMEAGAVGMSTGLVYPPGLFADEEELCTLQGEVARKGGLYASHVRGEGDTLLEAAEEFDRIVRRTNSQGQFSHIKASGKQNWGKVEKVIARIEKMNKDGLAVYFDKYPYIASSTSLQSMLSRWVLDGGRTKSEERLRDPSFVGKIVEEVKLNNEGKDGWNSVLISQAYIAEYEQYQGKTIAEIAQIVGKSPDDLFVELLLKSEMKTSICNFTMCQEETDMALVHPLGIPGSDSGVRANYGILSMDTPHPRAYGTFGKYFRDYVKERSLLTLEEAVRKSTALPCTIFGLKNRGLIAKGYYADVLIIDFDKYEDKATFADPHQYCSGLDAVIVNGTLTLWQEKQTGKRAGRVLKHNQA